MVKDILDRLLLLERTEIFSHLNLDELTRIAHILREEELDEKEILFQQGDRGNTAYIVISGTIEIYLPQSPKDQILTTMKEGSFFGEMALLDGEARSASARSTEKTRLFSLDRNSFLKVLKQFPSISLGIISVFSSRLRESNQKHSSMQHALRDFSNAYSRNQSVMDELK